MDGPMMDGLLLLLHRKTMTPPPPRTVARVASLEEAAATAESRVDVASPEEDAAPAVVVVVVVPPARIGRRRRRRPAGTLLQLGMKVMEDGITEDGLALVTVTVITLDTGSTFLPIPAVVALLAVRTIARVARAVAREASLAIAMAMEDPRVANLVDVARAVEGALAACRRRPAGTILQPGMEDGTVDGPRPITATMTHPPRPSLDPREGRLVDAASLAEDALVAPRHQATIGHHRMLIG